MIERHRTTIKKTEQERNTTIHFWSKRIAVRPTCSPLCNELKSKFKVRELAAWKSEVLSRRFLKWIALLKIVLLR